MREESTNGGETIADRCKAREEVVYCPITMADPDGPYACIEVHGGGKCYFCPCETLQEIRNAASIVGYTLWTMDGSNANILDAMKYCFGAHIPDEPVTD